MKKIILLNNRSNSQCQICFEPIEKMEEVYKLNCSCKDKYYHEDCIFNWFQKKNSCPFCFVEHHFNYKVINFFFYNK